MIAAHGPVNGVGCGCAICVCEELRKRFRARIALLKKAREEEIREHLNFSSSYLHTIDAFGVAEEMLDEVMVGARTAEVPL